ncbi:MAG: hypothetical protein KC413_09975, partial [Anaerolineales bacterium]|nr:hypothetical protein [Anaerolineales bacterium]
RIGNPTYDKKQSPGGLFHETDALLITTGRLVIVMPGVWSFMETFVTYWFVAYPESDTLDVLAVNVQAAQLFQIPIARTQQNCTG